MKQAEKGDKVKIRFTGKLDDGTVVDASEDCSCESCECEDDRLEFTIGEEEVIPGLEEAVIGMRPGETKTVRIVSDQAYGPYDEEMVMQVERSEFPEDIQPEVGQMLELTDDEGEAFVVTVAEVSDESVTLDANHPLAGQDITYDLELVEIG